MKKTFFFFFLKGIVLEILRKYWRSIEFPHHIGREEDNDGPTDFDTEIQPSARRQFRFGRHGRHISPIENRNCRSMNLECVCVCILLTIEIQNWQFLFLALISSTENVTSAPIVAPGSRSSRSSGSEFRPRLRSRTESLNSASLIRKIVETIQNWNSLLAIRWNWIWKKWCYRNCGVFRSKGPPNSWGYWMARKK